jgi:hypothetical protein
MTPPKTDDRYKLDRRPTCPKCNIPMLVIVYGLPSDATIERYKRGKIALGGCIIHNDNPEYQCPECGYQC